MNKKQFIINSKEGIHYIATELTRIVISNNHYCVYTIPKESGNNVYVSKVVNNMLEPIKDEKEQNLLNNIIKSLIDRPSETERSK